MEINNTHRENLYINISKNKNSREDNNTSSIAKSKKSSNVIYAGDLNVAADPIALKKQQAQKKAMKSIIEQFKNEKKTDDGITTLHEKQANLLSDAGQASNEIKNLRNLRRELKDSYGITDDSAEQVNLDVLEKSIYGTEELTEDEQTRLKNMGSLTEYQKSALQYDAMEKEWQRRLDNAKNGVSSINKSITSIGIERLKTHPMVDAQKEALGILEAARKEVIGAIVQQAKETEAKKLEENEEKADKQQEAKKEEEAKKEAAAQKNDIAAGTQASQQDKSASDTNNLDTSDITEAQSDQQQLLNDLKDFAAKQKMLEEDIKGILVDEQA